MRSPSSGAKALRRFLKNQASLTAAVIILILLAFSLAAPLFSPYAVGFRDGFYRSMPPIFAKWRTQTGPQAVYDYYASMGAVGKVAATGEDFYTLRIDAYQAVGWQYLDLSVGEYEALRAYEQENGVQICFPVPKNHATFYPAVGSGANLWYELADDSAYSTGRSAHHQADGTPIFVANYLTDEEGNFVYGVKNQTGYRCRVLYRAYYAYKNGFSPRHLFGTNQHGQDIFVCLAAGARLSFALALSVSALNFLIGLAYGGVEGYFGGRTDLILERVADILAAIPFIVVATLFQLHLAAKAGAAVSLLFSFVLTGWIGLASRVRVQFYRFKGAEYVQCARTLGASHWHIILRHILPNALGTVITGAVLLIPGVIFSESMLSYLGIVNLETGNLTSIGTMLANGRAYLSTQPHILLFPAVFLALLEISFNLFGNGLRDAIDPTQS